MFLTIEFCVSLVWAFKVIAVQSNKKEWTNFITVGCIISWLLKVQKNTVEEKESD